MGVSKESVVRAVVERLEAAFGKSTMVLLQIHMPQYNISFEDTSIVDEPEKFTEAMSYTFGTGAEALFNRINLALMLYAPIDPLDDLTTSGSAGFVLLIYKLKKTCNF
jgi:hypothetical protein